MFPMSHSLGQKETIAAAYLWLEKALGMDILQSTLSYVNGYSVTDGSSQHYLNDSGGAEFAGNIKTSDYVDGYKPKRK